MTEPKRYGTNNEQAFKPGECPDSPDTKHQWEHGMNLGRCYNSYKCTVCGATCQIDSSD